MGAATCEVAYLLKESFGQLWSYQSEGWARAFFERWKEGLKSGTGDEMESGSFVSRTDLAALGLHIAGDRYGLGPVPTRA